MEERWLPPDRCLCFLHTQWRNISCSNTFQGITLGNIHVRVKNLQDTFSSTIKYFWVTLQLVSLLHLWKGNAIWITRWHCSWWKRLLVGTLHPTGKTSPGPPAYLKGAVLQLCSLKLSWAKFMAGQCLPWREKELTHCLLEDRKMTQKTSRPAHPDRKSLSCSA